MAEKIPKTIEELDRILGRTNWDGVLVQVLSWLAAAEPRLRPVSEAPGVGDWIAEHIRRSDGSEYFASCYWRPGSSFAPQVLGWILLSRAPEPRNIREMAEALGEPPTDIRRFRSSINGEIAVDADGLNALLEYAHKAAALRRAVLERESVS